ncbi:MAG: hypothetical protein KDC34_17460 [Saprospiraceae bacterium]|nr:hypothetical protein [Saprospiraceae bacterium]
MKRNRKKILLIALLIFIGWAGWQFRTADILGAYPEPPAPENAEKLGLEFLQKMERAYGGKDTWLNYQEGYFIQYANWYGRLRMSGWDTLPQLYSLTATLGSDDCQMELLGGFRKGLQCSIESGQYQQTDVEPPVTSKKADRFAEKMLFKNYWFQFPFRIGEAPFVRYWGKRKIEDLNYDLLYITWGSLKANKTYDQYMLYLHPETHLIEHLHFTVRDRYRFLDFTAKFTDFREVDSLRLPYSQYVRMGAPWEHGVGFHENHYEYIHFGERAQ